MLFHTYNSYLKRAYGGGEVGKICIDGGFTCPNRDGTAGYGGCTFCGERGAGEHLPCDCSVRAQVEAYFSRPHRQKKFVAYFQNFSSTYAPPALLRKRYTDALCDDRIVALAIGTRPDCINEEVVEVLRDMQKRTDVWVELGLQTVNDDTARRVRRGYDTRVYDEAVSLLQKNGIKVAVHLMIGLPGESAEDVRRTVAHVARQHLFGVKFHCVYVMDGTDLENEYREGRYTPIDRDTYIDAVVDALRHLPPEVVILRLMADCPKDRLVAPSWNIDKDGIHAEIRRRLAEGGAQGCLYRF